MAAQGPYCPTFFPGLMKYVQTPTQHYGCRLKPSLSYGAQTLLSSSLMISKGSVLPRNNLMKALKVSMMPTKTRKPITVEPVADNCQRSTKLNAIATPSNARLSEGFRIRGFSAFAHLHGFGAVTGGLSVLNQTRLLEADGLVISAQQELHPNPEKCRTFQVFVAF